MLEQRGVDCGIIPAAIGERAALPPSAAAGISLLPQAARLKASSATKISDISFFILLFPLFVFCAGKLQKA